MHLNEDEAPDEMKMFGGLCFTVNGRIVVGVMKDRVIVRLSAQDIEAARSKGLVAPFDITGKQMAHFAFLSPAESASEDSVLAWAKRSLQYVREHKLAAKLAARRRTRKAKG